jgi:adenine-specific DNA-methyltransferase
MPIRREQVSGHELFDVDCGSLIACFERDVDENVVREMARRQPMRAVFRDDGFATDAARINAEQMFREVSPSTEVKAI